MFKRLLKDSLCLAIGFVLLISPAFVAGIEASADEPVVSTPVVVY